MPRPDSPRLRIAMFTYSTQPRGGVLHALALAQALQAEGHTAVLYALDDTRGGFVRQPRCAHVLVPVAPYRAAILPFVQRRIQEYVAGWDPMTPPFDVYHAHDGISGNALATLVEHGAIPAFVRTVHHLDDFTAPEMIALQDRSIREAAQTFVVSAAWRERLRAAYGITATVVPNGVDTGRFSPLSAAERTALRVRLGYHRGPLFVTIGGIEARKNTLSILEAFARVRATLPAAQLVIAGGASVFDHSAYRSSFERRAAELALILGESVRVLGVQTDAQIVALLRAAHAFVFPSLVEGFGLVLLEALACATPVVTSAIPPFSEFLGPRDALLVDPRDPAELAAAMLAALAPEVADRTARRGPALASRYAWSASAQAHLAAYRPIVYA